MENKEFAFDLSKFPQYVKYEIKEGVLYLYRKEDVINKRSRPIGYTVGFPGYQIEWYKRILREIEALESSTAWNKKWEIQGKQQRAEELKYLLIPAALHQQAERAKDKEIKWLDEATAGKQHGENFGKRVDAENSKIKDLNLKPGDRIVDNNRGTKYVFQRYKGQKTIVEGITRAEYILLREHDQEQVVIQDFKIYSRLQGSGPVVCDSFQINEILRECDLYGKDSAEYIARTIKRWCKINQVNIFSEKHIPEIVKLIKNA